MKPLLPINMNFDETFFEGEWRSDHYVTSTMKKVWAIDIDLLNEFMKFCKEYNFKYFVAFGSLIGAMRHGGFIPWDDDIDVLVPRKDYEKMLKVAPDYFKNPYFFQTERTDPGFSRSFARLRNSMTTAISEEELECQVNFNQGIWIDIFPMDNLPDDIEERKKWISGLNELHTKMWKFSRVALYYRISSKNGNIFRRGLMLTGPLVKFICKKGKIKNPYYEKYEKLAKRYMNEDTKMVGLLWFKQLKDKLYWDKSWFDTSKIVDFENIRVTIPGCEEEFLTHVYNDWRTPVKGTAMHQKTMFDPENSYVLYVKNPDQLRMKVKQQESERPTM